MCGGGGGRGDGDIPVSFEFPIIYVGTGKVADLWIHSILCVQHNHHWAIGILSWGMGGGGGRGVTCQF